MVSKVRQSVSECGDAIKNRHLESEFGNEKSEQRNPKIASERTSERTREHASRGEGGGKSDGEREASEEEGGGEK